MEEEYTAQEIKPEIEDYIKLNGTWENKNRSITAAAFIGLIGIGALYFNAQSILASLVTVIYQGIYHTQISGNILERINTITRELKTPMLIIVVLTQYTLMLFPTLWIVKRWHTTQIKKYLRVRFCSFKEIILAVLITISLLPLSYYISYTILERFKLPEVFNNVSSSLFTANSLGQFIFMIIVVAVTPAICEEIFFRGYVQRTLERTIGAKSFIVTGIIFGLFHMQPLSLISLSLLGVLLSFFYYRSKSIFPSSASHFTNNLIAITLLYDQEKFAKLGIPLNGNTSLSFLIVSLIIAFGLFIVYLKITRANKYEEVLLSQTVEISNENINEPYHFV